MARQKILNIPLNRVEGDLEISVAIEDGVVTDAWSSGLMYRGIENILTGRAALDGLVITPRICGICTTSHLTAAAQALDAAFAITPPPDAVKVRNLALLCEMLQSDVKHGFLMFAVDFVNRRYAGHPLFAEAERRYTPFRGETVLQAIRETSALVEIIALIGGQWPHSSFMVPGGIASAPSAGDLLQCRINVKRFRAWYEERVLGCRLERWREVQSAADLDAWLAEDDAHRQGELGFFLRFAREADLARTGRGHGNFLSYGAFPLPAGTAVRPLGKNPDLLVPPGFLAGTAAHATPFHQEKIAEHLRYSWYEDDTDPLHPALGQTRPYASGDEGGKYSWAKAPRYDGRPAETGPLAEMLISGQPLFTDLAARAGASTFLRQLARLVRPALLLPALETWSHEIDPNGLFYRSPAPVADGEGIGLTQVPRGALGHWLTIKDGRIARYQIITPTAWNGSPRDNQGTRGPWEEALIGASVADPDNPVELGHVVRSFDACLVCTVHQVRGDRTRAGQTWRVGL
ncbi:MAG: nickel-dependent hydrogenase large subunit [Thermodesulfobacteriota bacterium]